MTSARRGLAIARGGPGGTTNNPVKEIVMNKKNDHRKDRSEKAAKLLRQLNDKEMGGVAGGGCASCGRATAIVIGSLTAAEQ
jgi:hypothetical protein